MTVEGRITVDALFHDKDGTNAINVLSLSSSHAYATDKVALVTGTVSQNTLTLYTSSALSYRDAAGNPVSVISPSVLAASGNDLLVEAYGQGNLDEEYVFSAIYSNGRLSTTVLPYQASELRLRSINGTSTYSVLIYGQ